MLATSNAGETAAPRKAKRPRIKEACGACRERKTRCDGHKPICQACACRGVGETCRYDGPVKQQSGGGGARPSEPTSLPPRTGQHSEPQMQRLRTISATPQTAARPVALPTPADSAPDGATPHPSYVAQSDGTGVIAEGQGGSVYGPSSIITFLRHVAAPSDGRERLGRAERVSNGTKAREGGSVEAPSFSGEGFFQPRRREADDFLLCYWGLIHPLFPILYRPDFTKRYESIWLSYGAEPPMQHDPYFTRTLDLVFAIGCKLSSTIPQAQRNSAADHFYQRSRDVLLHDLLDATSLPLVQILLLEAVYLQSTQHSTRCVNMLCLAIRSAQTLGLHLPSDGAEVSRVDAEMRLRIWHTCLTLDR